MVCVIISVSHTDTLHVYIELLYLLFFVQEHGADISNDVLPRGCGEYARDAGSLGQGEPMYT